MDYVFSRHQTGYDAVVLAYRQKDGNYDTYLLGKDKLQERFMLHVRSSHEEKILEASKAWLKEHLPNEDELILLETCKTKERYRQLKRVLREKNMVYEVRKGDFYIRKGDFDPR